MALIDEVKQVCDRLASVGWRDLLLQQGLDITAINLQQELTKELPAINRQIVGFEDFAFEGKRGIEAGNPSRSLLFHALASPNVVSANLGAYPTLAELEIIENFVYGVQPPSLQDLQVLAPRQPLAIAVFACEYRPASETVHRQHADSSGWTWTAKVRLQLYQWTRLSFVEQKIAKDWLPNEFLGLKIYQAMRAANVTWRIVSQPAG